MKWRKRGVPFHWGGRFQDIPKLTELQVFWTPTDLTVDNGATQVIPIIYHTGCQPRHESNPQEIPIAEKMDSVYV